MVLPVVDFLQFLWRAVQEFLDVVCGEKIFCYRKLEAAYPVVLPDCDHDAVMEGLHDFDVVHLSSLLLNSSSICIFLESSSDSDRFFQLLTFESKTSFILDLPQAVHLTAILGMMDWHFSHCVYIIELSLDAVGFCIRP